MDFLQIANNPCKYMHAQIKDEEDDIIPRTRNDDEKWERSHTGTKGGLRFHLHSANQRHLLMKGAREGPKSDYDATRSKC